MGWQPVPENPGLWIILQMFAGFLGPTLPPRQRLLNPLGGGVQVAQGALGALCWSMWCQPSAVTSSPAVWLLCGSHSILRRLGLGSSAIVQSSSHFLRWSHFNGLNLLCRLWCSA